jgi:lipopolysaccharide export system permease protein
MIRLDRYVAETLLATTLLAWSVIVVLNALFGFLGDLGDIGRGDYGLREAALCALLHMPGGAWQTFPMAVLIGCLMGLGSLATQWELTAFRLAGCSTLRLLRAALQAGAVMLAAALVLGELLAPPASQLAVRLRASALYADVSVQSGAGFWVRDGQRLIRVGNSAADGSLANLSLFDLDDDAPRLRRATAVATARFGDGKWLLEDVRESIFADRSIDVSVSEQGTLERLVPPELAQLLSRDTQTLNLAELQQYIAYLTENGADAAAVRLNYWQRLTAPLAVLAMLVLSVSLVLGPLGRQSVGKRVLIGVLIGLAFKLFNDINAYAGLVFGVPPWINALLPSVLVSAAGLLMLRRFS